MKCLHFFNKHWKSISRFQLALTKGFDFIHSILRSRESSVLIHSTHLSFSYLCVISCFLLKIFSCKCIQPLGLVVRISAAKNECKSMPNRMQEIQREKYYENNKQNICEERNSLHWKSWRKHWKSRYWRGNNENNTNNNLPFPLPKTGAPYHLFYI